MNFDDNITGIVGPNGCGKSNIVDSIRWVIGEQKISQLRSENLDSLVFNGSKSRSASGYAEGFHCRKLVSEVTAERPDASRPGARKR